MALKKHQTPKPRAVRVPGDNDREWTARNARLERNATGRWVIKYTEKQLINGKPDDRTRTLSTGETNETAANDFLSRWRKAYVTAMKDDIPRPTFQDAVHAYKAADTARCSNTNSSTAQRLCVFLGTDAVDTIDERRLGELHDWLKKSGKAPGTIRNDLSVVLTVLNHAERNHMIPKNSAPTYKLPPVPPPRPHSLTEAQRETVFAAAAAWSQDSNALRARVGLFVCIALETAQRRDAIRELTWDRINFSDTPRGPLKAKKIDFRRPGHNPANKKRCPAAPISPDLMVVLQRVAPDDLKGPVFPRTRIIEGFHAFRDMLNMPDWFTPHVFRHTWVTLAWETDIPLQHISFMTGDTIATLQRTYAHLNADVSEQKFDEFLWSKRNTYKANDNERTGHVATELAG